MTLGDIYGLQNALRAVGQLGGEGFGYAMARNATKVDRIIELAEKKYRKPHSDEQAFQEAMVQICEEHCTKDENGQPVLERGMFQGLQGNPEFDKAIDALREEYKELEDFKKEQQEKFNEALDIEVEGDFEFKPHLIDRDRIPKNATVDQIKGILPLIAPPPE